MKLIVFSALRIVLSIIVLLDLAISQTIFYDIEAKSQLMLT